MKLYATVSSERATKGQGGNEFLEIVISGAHQTELITLKLLPNGSGYELQGWTHDNHFVQVMIEENLTKGERQKGKACAKCGAGTMHDGNCAGCWAPQELCTC